MRYEMRIFWSLNKYTQWTNVSHIRVSISLSLSLSYLKLGTFVNETNLLLNVFCVFAAVLKADFLFSVAFMSKQTTDSSCFIIVLDCVLEANSKFVIVLNLLFQNITTVNVVQFTGEMLSGSVYYDFLSYYNWFFLL